jgi:endonuclease/exonuclease/phosphatase family metal-dependent hydrolase
VDVFLADLGYEHLVLVEGNDQRGIDVALLSRLPVGRVVSHAELRFEPDVRQDGAKNFQRDLLCVELRPPGKESFQVWVVHLKSKGGEDTSELIRLSEARQIRQLVDQTLATEPAARFVICGDFNDQIDSKSLRTILGEGAQSLRTFFETVPPEDRITFNQEPYRNMIDFILGSPAMAERFVKDSYEIVHGSVESTGSDHNPVSCRFRLRPAEPASVGTPLLPRLASADAENATDSARAPVEALSADEAAAAGSPEAASPAEQEKKSAKEPLGGLRDHWWIGAAAGLAGLAAGLFLARWFASRPVG